MPVIEYQKVMKRTGLTDQFLGSQWQCPKCGKKYWTAWGHCQRHYEKCCKEEM